jgi:protein TonB
MYLYEQPPPSRRLVTVAFVLLLHVATVYALVTGPARQAVDILHPPIETLLPDEIEPPATPPPPPLLPPMPQFAMPTPPDIPLPEIRVRQPGPPAARASSNAIVPVTHEKAPEPAAVVRTLPEPARVSPHVEVGKNCLVPDYPAAAKAAGEAGTVALRFLVDTNGRVVESQVETSSGFPRLDEAARAALSLCQFTLGTVDGRPERSWTRLRYVWKIR